MPAYVIYGDSFLVAQELKRLEQKTGCAELLEANRHQFNGNDLKLPELLAVCNALPFMDPCRWVVVTGLLAAQESQSGRGRRRSSRSNRSGAAGRSAGGWDDLSVAIPQMPDTTQLILVDHTLSESNSQLRSLKLAANIQRFDAPNGEALARYIKDLARGKGAGISPAAVKTLTDLVGNDLWTLDQELEKLALYAAGNSDKPMIDEAHIQEMVSQVREASIFNAVDAMLDGRSGLALRLLQQLRRDGAALPYIIVMTERQLRLLALARYWSEQRVSQTEMAGKLGVPPFVARRAVEQARRHSWPDINRMYQLLLNTDLSIKTGKVESEDMALELLVADLAGAHKPIGR